MWDPIEPTHAHTQSRTRARAYAFRFLSWFPRSLVSLEQAWTLTLEDVAETDEPAERSCQLGGFGCRGETFVHWATSLGLAFYDDVDVGPRNAASPAPRDTLE